MADISCANCQMELPYDPQEGDPLPCPHCGSVVQSCTVEITDGFVFHDGHRARAKNPALPSAKKLRFDTYSDVEHSHKYGKLVRVHRTIDKDRDWYSEQVVDPQTGEILHECSEPLSQHVGHGTAKPRIES